MKTFCLIVAILTMSSGAQAGARSTIKIYEGICKRQPVVSMPQGEPGVLPLAWPDYIILGSAKNWLRQPAWLQFFDGPFLQVTEEDGQLVARGLFVPGCESLVGDGQSPAPNVHAKLHFPDGVEVTIWVAFQMAT